MHEPPVGWILRRRTSKYGEQILLHFVYPFIHLWTLGLLPPWLLWIKNATMNTGVQISLQDLALNSFGNIPEVRWLDRVAIQLYLFSVLFCHRLPEKLTSHIWELSCCSELPGVVPSNSMRKWLLQEEAGVTPSLGRMPALLKSPACYTWYVSLWKLHTSWRLLWHKLLRHSRVGPCSEKPQECT